MWEQAKINDWAWNKQLSSGPRLEMAGLRHAGVNPMLPYAAGGSGPHAGGFNASVPAPVNNMEPIQEGLTDAAATALDAIRKEAEVKKATEEVKTLQATQKNLAADTVQKYSNENLNHMLAGESFERTRTHHWQAENAELANQSAKSSAAQAKIDQQFFESDLGKIMRQIDKIGQSLNPFASSAKSASGAIR